MKKLIRRLSRVADSSPYSLLRSEPRSSPTAGRLCDSFRITKPRRSGTVPEGHLPVYVGEEMERFVVSADLLNHPIFINLLNKSAQEYGYEQKGVLRIPCHVFVFERVLEALRDGKEASHNVQDLLSDEFLSRSVSLFSRVASFLELDLRVASGSNRRPTRKSVLAVSLSLWTEKKGCIVVIEKSAFLFPDSVALYF